MKTSQLPSKQTMTAAFMSRDVTFDGIFITAVHTTGIFCRPTCHAKKPRPENITFYPSHTDALDAGYRPCKVCRPLEPQGQTPLWVQGLLQAFDVDPDRRWLDADIARQQVDPVKARRWFKANYGMTFHAYARARRLGRALGQIKNGSSVIRAAFDQGYDSLSGFNDAFRKLVGTSPTSAARAPVIYLKRLSTPLGTMLAAADADRLFLLEFMDRRALERQLLTLHHRTQAAIIPGKSPLHDALEDELADYFAGDRREFSIPLAAPGTPFQEQVWSALREIPYGETRSYHDIAVQIDRATAVRAVANANGNNRLALIIPCHRVIGSDGRLTGYGGGLWRKRRLLEIEGAEWPQ